MSDSIAKKKFISDPKTKTQRAALQILNKEEINAKRNRLECLLLQQLQAKYGNPNIPGVNEFIKSAVRDFVASHDNILAAEAMVGDLESTVRNGTAKIKDDQKSKKIAQQAEEQRQLENSRNISRTLSAGNRRAHDSSKNIEGNQWPVINAILAISDEQIKQKEAREAEEKKLRFQEELRKQIQSNKSKLLEQQREKQMTLEKNKVELANYEMEKQQEEHKKELNFRNERSMRLGQIQERKEVREYERQQRIAIEQLEMARARRMAMEEEEAKRNRKEEQKRQQDLLFVENEKNKAVKQDLLRNQQEYEKKLNREYEEKLEREEQARQMAFKARMESLEQSAKKYELKVGSKIQDEKDQRLQLEQAQMRQKEKADQDREKSKQEKRKNDLMESTMFNLNMAEKKRLEKEKDRLEAIERKHLMEKDVQELKRKEKEIIEQKKLKMIEMKMTLDQQVNTKHSQDQQLKSLSEMEKQLNKSIIKKLNDDPKLLEKVVERVNPGPTSRVISGNNLF